MNTRQFVTRNHVTASVALTDHNPNMEGSWAADANHWKVTLRMRGRRMQVPFSTGSALGEPEAADVLDCLASDASSVQYSSSFEDWASDLGFDPDSRKAERSWQVTVRQSARLQKFLGADLYRELLDAERL